MPKCGCGGGCSCVVVGGDNVTVTGSGIPGAPYVIDAEGFDPDTFEGVLKVNDQPGPYVELGAADVGAVSKYLVVPIVFGNAALAPDTVTSFNASAAPRTATLPALNDALTGRGARILIEKDPLDTTSNAVTIAMTGADTFRQGTTGASLIMPGERLEVQAMKLGATRYWKIIGHSAPRSSFDAYYARAEAAVTIEELERDVAFVVSAAAETFLLGADNFDIRSGALSLQFSTSLAVNNTNYWTVQLLRYRSTDPPQIIATKTTKTTGQAIVAYSGWSFDNVDWPEALRYLRRTDGLALLFTPTGSPPALGKAVAVLRYEPNTQPVFRDSFTRNDSITSLGQADTTQAWQANAGVWGIKTQAASIHNQTGDSGGTRSWAQISGAGDSGCTSAKLIDAVNAGIGVRGRKETDGTTSGYTHNSVGMFKVVHSVVTQIGANFDETFVNGDVITWSYVGNTHTIYRNGKQVYQAVDSTYTTGSNLLLRASSGVTVDTPLIDDLVYAA